MRFRHALKETAPVIEALLSGEQTVLLRRGGMGEDGFDLEARRFLLFPTRKEKKRGRYVRHNDLLTGERFDVERIEVAAEATDVIRVNVSPDDHPDALGEETLFTDEGLEKKLGYRPEVPLSVVVVRTYRVEPALELEMVPEYGGCTSWVELADGVEARCEPVLTDREHSERVERWRRSLADHVADD